MVATFTALQTAGQWTDVATGTTNDAAGSAEPPADDAATADDDATGHGSPTDDVRATDVPAWPPGLPLPPGHAPAVNVRPPTGNVWHGDVAYERGRKVEL